MLALGEPAGPPRSGAALEEATEELTSRMRCPVCQGLPVADSPVQAALSMKAEVHDLLAAGYSEEQILDYFERSYGEFIRLEPKVEGLNWVVWLAPAVVLLFGAALVAARLRSRRRARGPAAPAADLDEYVERVRREVAG